LQRERERESTHREVLSDLQLIRALCLQAAAGCDLNKQRIIPLALLGKKAACARVYLFWHLFRRNQRRAFLEKINSLRQCEREKEGKHIWHNISNQTRVRRQCY